MINYFKFREDGGKICRDCLNKKYHVSLEPQDCRYFYYQRTCPYCGKVKRIITGIRPKKKWSILLRGKL